MNRLDEKIGFFSVRNFVQIDRIIRSTRLARKWPKVF